MLGAQSPYQRPGEWNFAFSTRTLRSDTHYRLDQRQVQRETLGTYVINRQFAADLSVSYNCTQRLSLTAGIPWIAASWSIPSPTSPIPGPRAQQDARGLGDISVVSHYWLFNPATFTGNVAIGGGVKFPTGTYDARDTFPDSQGRNNQLRYVDQSVQPGDGGWGFMLSIEGFKRLGRVQAFGSGNYLANPRDTNGTPSLTVSRLPPGASPSAANFDRLVNSVPDQYLVRVGAGMPVWRNLAANGTLRVEGLRRYDLIGPSHGFRRPGVELFFEPGVSWAARGQSFTINVPVGFYKNRKPDPYTGLEGDATFPKYIFLATYGWRFGGKDVACAVPPPS